MAKKSKGSNNKSIIYCFGFYKSPINVSEGRIKQISVTFNNSKAFLKAKDPNISEIIMTL
jgi:hypothetical protein